jgi:hypothetical protein
MVRFAFQKRNKTILFLSFFLLIQFLSLILSVRTDLFSIGRMLAHLHNIFAFCFIFFGYYLLSHSTYRSYLIKYIPKLFYWIILIIVVSSIYSILTKSELEYRGVLAFLGIDNKLTNVYFNRIDWFIFSSFPRTKVFGIYPNSTGLLLILLHALLISLCWNYWSSKKKHFSFFLLFFGCFMTGSRTFVILSLLLYTIFLTTSKLKLNLFLLVIPVLALFSFPLLEYFLSLREGSNDARSNIYLASIALTMENGPLFGLGLKPILPNLNIPYPLGSHSTYIGYFTKCGLIGFTFIAGAVLYVSGGYIKSLIHSFHRSSMFERIRFYRYSSFILILVALILEDLDSYELLTFVFGMNLWMFDNRGLEI